MNTTQEFLERCNALMMGRAPREILLRAMDRIRDPERWAHGAQALDAQGKKVVPSDPSAVQWDVQGAIAIECNPYGILPPYFMQLLDELAEPYGCDSVGMFNDAYSHERVLHLMQSAADRCPT